MLGGSTTFQTCQCVQPSGWGGWVVDCQLFSRMPNLRSKIFPFIKCSVLCFSQGGGGGLTTNFFQDAKSEVKNFSLYEVCWTLFFSGGGVNHQLFSRCQIWGQKFFPLWSVLDSVFLRVGGGWPPTFFKDAKSEVKIFSLYKVLWTLFFSGWDGGVDHQLFQGCQIWGQNFFPLLSTLDSCFSQGRVGQGVDCQLFQGCQIWGLILLETNLWPPRRSIF